MLKESNCLEVPFCLVRYEPAPYPLLSPSVVQKGNFIIQVVLTEGELPSPLLFFFFFEITHL